MRNRFLVSYDVRDSKRLRRLFKALRGFGDPLQYSVFRCDLSPKEKILLIAAIKEIINHRDDRVMLVDLGPAASRGSECVVFLGESAPPPIDEAVIV